MPASREWKTFPYALQTKEPSATRPLALFIDEDSGSDDSDASYAEGSVPERSSDDDNSSADDPDIIELSSDPKDEAQVPLATSTAKKEDPPGSKANPIVLATPSPAKKQPKHSREESPESPSPRPPRKTRRLVNRAGPPDAPEDAAASEARALRILAANIRVDTNPGCRLAMARSGLAAMIASNVVAVDEPNPIPRLRPGQSPNAETVQYFTVAEERQMREWELYQVVRSAFITGALEVLRAQDPRAPYAVLRRKYTLYLDPFQAPPPLADVDPAHKCGNCGCLASHPVLLWCNHLFCFCPRDNCGAVQRRPPWRRVDLEEEIEQTYTGFLDPTQVIYGWSDVHFPSS
ncbi:hypothetical protein C8F01DRAFT_1093504 [Mycena amicta]|nr:hypothetical protein C8F01DRAFT_1093504 [Mycena amicta]